MTTPVFTLAQFEAVDVSRRHVDACIVAGPGSGRPVAVSASASDSAPIPAAVHPASTATPTSSGHTSARRSTGAVWVASPIVSPAGRATVMYPGY